MTTAPAAATPPRPAPTRLLSLDAFRGATIAAMILVNDPGDGGHVYWPLQHARWNGWTPTDLIFPFFVFMMGMSLTFSTRLHGKEALARAARLFALGLVVNSWPFIGMHHLRIPGVLQRIALCYLAAWAARRWLRPATQGLLAAVLLVGYWLVMTHVTGPEGYAPNLEMQTNLSAQVDRALLRPFLYEWTRTWDPEGVLSTFPAIASALLGLLAGEWLRRGQPRRDGAGAMTPAATSPSTVTLGLLAAGAVLTLGAMYWGEWAPSWLLFPINKGLWTPSFVLLTAGLGSALFGLSYWVIDVNGWQRWAAPFVSYGRNAIALYVGSELLAATLGAIRWAGADGTPVSLYERVNATLFASWLPPYDASLAFALATVLLWYVVAVVLDHRRIYIKA
ncbi:MAG TPA: heparan-alpha-glucosaminide N-acetyltransferase domain-containing protein [Vicinamibacteria bacterium]|nr:heparan-alpha-glucosaminide N-acetyltransferase domain-containing protein [Vicinamibacteria bacterium]